MAELKFKVQPSGEPLKFSGPEAGNADKVTQAAQAWAEANSLDSLTFWQDADSPHKLVVQFDDEPPLASWVDVAVFREGRVDDIEGPLDYARGEHRRRMAGFEKYDR